jgi:hypothetical protein
VELVADVSVVAWLREEVLRGPNGIRWSYAPGVVNRGTLTLDAESFPTLKIVEENLRHYFQWRVNQFLFRIQVGSVEQIRTFIPETTVMSFDLTK